MPEPSENVGKICISLEKYYNTRTRDMDVKPRPVLIIGFEDDYISPLNVDYEILPISTMLNRQPHPVYDIYIGPPLHNQLGLNNSSYIRTHKTTWNHSKHIKIESPTGDLKETDQELFNQIMILNQKWVNERCCQNMISNQEEIATTEEVDN